jgi:type I restriction-modification system DNA methylase subunit
LSLQKTSNSPTLKTLSPQKKKKNSDAIISNQPLNQAKKTTKTQAKKQQKEHTLRLRL